MPAIGLTTPATSNQYIIVHDHANWREFWKYIDRHLNLCDTFPGVAQLDDGINKIIRLILQAANYQITDMTLYNYRAQIIIPKYIQKITKQLGCLT